MYGLNVTDCDLKDGYQASIYYKPFLEPPHVSGALIGRFSYDIQADLDKLGIEQASMPVHELVKGKPTCPCRGG